MPWLYIFSGLEIRGLKGCWIGYSLTVLTKTMRIDACGPRDALARVREIAVEVTPADVMVSDDAQGLLSATAMPLMRENKGGADMQ